MQLTKVPRRDVSPVGERASAPREARVLGLRNEPDLFRHHLNCTTQPAFDPSRRVTATIVRDHANGGAANAVRAWAAERSFAVIEAPITATDGLAGVITPKSITNGPECYETCAARRAAASAAAGERVVLLVEHGERLTDHQLAELVTFAKGKRYPTIVIEGNRDRDENAYDQVMSTTMNW